MAQNRKPAHEARRNGSSKIDAAAVEARLQQAIKLRQAGKLREAEAICQELLAKFPDYVGALYTLGMVHIDNKNFGHALPCLVQAAMHNPADFRIMTNLAGVYLELEVSEMAAQTYERALALKDDVPEIHFNLGMIYMERREYQLAAHSFERTLVIQPAHASALVLLGQCQAHLGRTEEAALAFHRAHKLDPLRPAPVIGLSDLSGSSVKLDLMKRIASAAEGRAVRDQKTELNIAFAKARALDSEGRYEEAWDAGMEANRKHTSFNNINFERDRDINKKALEWAHNCPATVLEDTAAGDDIPTSLFVLGPSRSGKTTLERLLGEFGEVNRGYENHTISNAVRRTNQLSGRLSFSALSELPDGLYGEFSRIYVEDVSRRAGGAKVFTTTAPGHIADVARIAASIPRTRFVFVKRDVDDLAIRIFFKQYEHRHSYAYSVPNIYDFLKLYHGLMDVWAARLPQFVTVVDYNDMIADPAATIAQIAGFCGLNLPNGPLPRLGDDRGCGEPYRTLLAAARGGSNS